MRQHIHRDASFTTPFITGLIHSPWLQMEEWLNLVVGLLQARDEARRLATIPGSDESQFSFEDAQMTGIRNPWNPTAAAGGALTMDELNQYLDASEATQEQADDQEGQLQGMPLEGGEGTQPEQRRARSAMTTEELRRLAAARLMAEPGARAAAISKTLPRAGSAECFSCGTGPNQPACKR